MSNTVYEPSSPKIVNHVVKSAIFGGVAAVIWALVIHSAKAPGHYAIGLLSWPFLAGFLRNLHAFFARPHLRLTREGLQVRYWLAVDFPSFAMFRPWYRIVDVQIPWPDYRLCRTYTYSVNSIPRWKAVIIETTAVDHVIGWDVFSAEVGRLQSAILDYIEMEFRQPARQAMKLAEFCRRRFESPLRLSASSGGWTFPIVAFVLDLLSVGLIKYFVPKFPDTGWIWIPILITIVTIVGVVQVVEFWGKRVLELRSEGLALGGTAENMRVIPWEDILFVRRQTKSEGKGPESTESLEIRLSDRSSITLHHGYKRTLDDLHDILDPPIDKLAAAYERMAKGEDIESAVAAVGLPTRGS